MFSSLPLDNIKEATDAIPSAHQLIAVTLTNGDVLLGCLGKHWSWNGKTVDIAFNTEEGKQFGDSWIILVPLEEITDIQKVSLSRESIPTFEMDELSFEIMQKLNPHVEKRMPLYVQDYPNPLATVICRHNMDVNAKCGFQVFGYCERALATDHIPPEGIKFDEDLILYSDWEFFSRRSASPTRVGMNLGVTVSRDLGLPLQREVVERLKRSWLDTLRDKTDIDFARETTLRGQIVIPSPLQDTQIEGESCIVVICKVDEGESNAVLLKQKLLKYPLEFLGFVKSVLAFHGEMLPIPLTVAGQVYTSVMLARAIGYLKEIEEQHLSRRDSEW